MTIKPYLFFSGRADEAIAFYQQALGAEVLFLCATTKAPSRRRPACSLPTGSDKIMHSCLKIGDSEVFASDGCGNLSPGFNGFGVSIEAKNEAEAERIFGALADGGEVAHAARRDLLRGELRHGGRSLRRAVDGRRSQQVRRRLTKRIART